MRTVHVVQLRFELEPQLHLFFVVLCVLDVVFFQLHSHLTLVGELPLGFLGAFGDEVLVLFENSLVVGLLLEFDLILSVELVKFGFVFLADFRDEHSVIGATAVLKQDRVHLPDVRDYGIPFFCMLQAAPNKLVETN